MVDATELDPWVLCDSYEIPIGGVRPQRDFHRLIGKYDNWKRVNDWKIVVESDAIGDGTYYLIRESRVDRAEAPEPPEPGDRNSAFVSDEHMASYLIGGSVPSRGLTAVVTEAGRRL